MNPCNPYRITQEELNDFAQTLHSCGVYDEQERPLSFNINNFMVMRGLVVDLDGEVEQTIIKNLYPPVTEGVFYHFTSTDAAKIFSEKRKFDSIPLCIEFKITN